MRRLTVAVDLDNSVYDYNSAIARVIGKPDLPPVTDYDYSKCGWFQTQAEFLDTHRRAVADGLFLHMTPYIGAVEALRRLHDSGALIKIVTARGARSETRALEYDTTLTALANDGVPFDEAHFGISNKWSVDADLYIDDAPSVLRGLDERGLARLAFHHPYNEACAGPRFFTWTELPLALSRVL